MTVDGVTGLYVDGVPQILNCAAAEGVSCFHAAESFSLDTGCGKDLVGQRHVARLQQHVYHKGPFLLRTANGGSTASERIRLSVAPLAGTQNLT